MDKNAKEIVKIIFEKDEEKRKIIEEKIKLQDEFNKIKNETRDTINYLKENINELKNKNIDEQNKNKDIENKYKKEIDNLKLKIKNELENNTQMDLIKKLEFKIKDYEQIIDNMKNDQKYLKNEINNKEFQINKLKKEKEVLLAKINAKEKRLNINIKNKKKLFNKVVNVLKNTSIVALPNKENNINNIINVMDNIDKIDNKVDKIEEQRNKQIDKIKEKKQEKIEYKNRINELIKESDLSETDQTYLIPNEDQENKEYLDDYQYLQKMQEEDEEKYDKEEINNLQNEILNYNTEINKINEKIKNENDNNKKIMYINNLNNLELEKENLEINLNLILDRYIENIDDKKELQNIDNEINNYNKKIKNEEQNIKKYKSEIIKLKIINKKEQINQIKLIIQNSLNTIYDLKKNIFELRNQYNNIIDKNIKNNLNIVDKNIDNITNKLNKNTEDKTLIKLYNNLLIKDELENEINLNENEISTINDLLKEPKSEIIINENDLSNINNLLNEPFYKIDEKRKRFRKKIKFIKHNEQNENQRIDIKTKIIELIQQYKNYAGDSTFKKIINILSNDLTNSILNNEIKFKKDITEINNNIKYSKEINNDINNIQKEKTNIKNTLNDVNNFLNNLKENEKNIIIQTKIISQLESKKNNDEIININKEKEINLYNDLITNINNINNNINNIKKKEIENKNIENNKLSIVKNIFDKNFQIINEINNDNNIPINQKNIIIDNLKLDLNRKIPNLYKDANENNYTKEEIDIYLEDYKNKIISNNPNKYELIKQYNNDDIIKNKIMDLKINKKIDEINENENLLLDIGIKNGVLTNEQYDERKKNIIKKNNDIKDIILKNSEKKK